MSIFSKYQRQIKLFESGQETQQQLFQAKILCIGAGGLGCPALMYLVASGIGEVGIIDMDNIDITNLQRQILFTEKEVGKSKATIAQQKLQQHNLDVKVKSFNTKLQASNAMDIIKNYDLVIDGSDNFAAKFLINDTAVKLGIPVIYGSISGYEGYVSIFWAKYGPCYRCIYKEPPKQFIPNCAENGIIGPIAGIIGSMQAMEAIKLLIAKNNKNSKLKPLIGRMIIIDSMTMDITNIKLSKDKSCHVCNINPDDIKLTDYQNICDMNNTVKEVTIKEILNCNEKITFLDVREEYEREICGYINNSISIPLPQILQNNFNLSKNTLYVSYCAHGRRSKIAADYLANQQFNIKYFGGNYDELASNI